MSGYSENEREWAVVDRLATLLVSPPQTEYNVTQTYAFFTSILCWVMERIRTHGNNEADKLAKAVWTRLGEERAGQPPWFVDHRHDTRIAVISGGGNTVNRFVEWQDLSAAELLRSLRNATAHGDGRKVAPVLEWHENEERLVGFQFDCELRVGVNEPRTERWEVIWSGKIILKEPEMIAIGSGLAKMFCDELKKLDHKLDPEKARVLAEPASHRKAA